MIDHLLAVSLALVLDRLIGDPPGWPHPVKWMGTFISRADRLLNKGRAKKGKGVIMLAALLLLTGLLSYTLVYWAYSFHSAAGIVTEAILISSAIARRSLAEAGISVYSPLEAEKLDMAREKLSWIVGRDTADLDEAEIVRGTVETVAENTSDGITAPLFWAAVGGAPLAMLYRAVNTCDSMVGYRSEKYLDFGWASARLDDAANWIPSRITGLLMLFSVKDRAHSFKECLQITLRDAKKHPSPNSGWGEAAAASVLGVQLGGLNYYKGIPSERARMGTALMPLRSAHIKSAIMIMNRTVLLFFILLWIGGIICAFAVPWCKSSLFI